MIEIKHGDHKFYIGEDEQHIQAELTYKDQDSHTIIADHTYVSEEWRGEGIAGKLFNHLIAFARAEQLKIIPTCSYVEKKMTRTNEFDDVLAK